MSINGFVDVPLLHKFSVSFKTAEQQALREAADTGGVVLRVRSLKIGYGTVVVTGLIPSTALVFEDTTQAPGHLRPRSIGNLHLTWRRLLHANTSDEIGYLVLQTPVAATGIMPESEDGDLYWVALDIQRTNHTLPPGCIGAVCCVSCNRPIPDQRLKAIPNTKFCTACQQNKEKR